MDCANIIHPITIFLAGAILNYLSVTNSNNNDIIIILSARYNDKQIEGFNLRRN